MAGLGLTIERRWGWVLTLALAFAGIVFGVYLLRVPGDITAPGAAVLAAVYLFFLPSALLLWALFAPRARSWLLHRTEATGATPKPL